MPRVMAQGKSIECPAGANLRQVLLQHGIGVHNGAAVALNCQGLGTCGTCAALVEGDATPMEWREQARLGLAPHRIDAGRRLTCQVRVQGDVQVTKFEGFWGQGSEPEWTAAGPTRSHHGWPPEKCG